MAAAKAPTPPAAEQAGAKAPTPPAAEQAGAKAPTPELVRMVVTTGALIVGGAVKTRGYTFACTPELVDGFLAAGGIEIVED